MLATKLTVTLYKAVANSFTTAPAELKELGDSLFSLRCALSHLANHANTLTKAAAKTTKPTTGSGKGHEINPVEGLNHMIRSCLSTLKELDATTKKYREAADVVEPQPVGLASGNSDPSSAKASQKMPPGIRGRIRVNWLKIR